MEKGEEAKERKQPNEKPSLLKVRKSEELKKKKGRERKIEGAAVIESEED